MRVEALYRRHAPLLRARAASAAIKYRRPFDELHAEANYLFVVAAAEYDGSGTFKGHLKFRLRRLANYVRSDARRSKALARRPESLIWVAQAPPAPTATSPDADEVVRLVAGSRPGLRPNQIRRMVREYLTSVWGSKARVDRAFAEVSEVFG